MQVMVHIPIVIFNFHRFVFIKRTKKIPIINSKLEVQSFIKYIFSMDHSHPLAIFFSNICIVSTIIQLFDFIVLSLSIGIALLHIVHGFRIRSGITFNASLFARANKHTHKLSSIYFIHGVMFMENFDVTDAVL